MAVALSAQVSAHRLDEFLQAARIAIARDRVQLELSLTPGTAVADAVVRAIDGDRSGLLSDVEEREYADRVLEGLLLRVDDSSSLHLQLAGSRFPDVAGLRSGDGVIVIRAEAEISPLPAGAHRLLFHNNYETDNSVCLANALVPKDDDVAVTEQLHTADQSELTIDFVVSEQSVSLRRWVWFGFAGVLTLAALLLWRIRSGRDAKDP